MSPGMMNQELFGVVDVADAGDDAGAPVGPRVGDDLAGQPRGDGLAAMPRRVELLRLHHHQAQIHLGIGIDQQDTLLVVHGERLGYGHGQRRFADTALRIHDGY